MTHHNDFSDDRSSFPNDHLLTAYLEGALRGPELAAISAWIAEDPVHEERMFLLHHAWDASQPVPFTGNLAATLEAVRAHAQSPLQQQPVSAKQSRQSQWFRPAGITLGICAALILGVLVYPRTPNTNAGQPLQYVTAAGEHMVITLPDSSQVTLAPQTTLDLDAGFGNTTRTVTLIGEAFFEIKESAGAPFIVTASGVDTRVLGTTFSIRAYPTNEPVQVAVHSGKVSTQYRDGSDILTAGMIALVTDSNATVARIDNLNSYIGWNGNQLAFKDTPVPELLSALERWYGYQFRLTDSTLMSERVSTILTLSERDETLRALSQLLGVSMTLQDSVITLRPRRSNDTTFNKSSSPTRRDTRQFSLPTEFGK